jgi:hypothetical protein
MTTAFLAYLYPYGGFNDTQQAQTLEQPCASITAITLTNNMVRMDHNSTVAI